MFVLFPRKIFDHQLNSGSSFLYVREFVAAGEGAETKNAAKNVAKNVAKKKKTVRFATLFFHIFSHTLSRHFSWKFFAADFCTPAPARGEIWVDICRVTVPASPVDCLFLKNTIFVKNYSKTSEKSSPEPEN